eukprot:UN23077
MSMSAVRARKDSYESSSDESASSSRTPQGEELFILEGSISPRSNILGFPEAKINDKCGALDSVLEIEKFFSDQKLAKERTKDMDSFAIQPWDQCVI